MKGKKKHKKIINEIYFYTVYYNYKVIIYIFASVINL